ncbi:MAG: hypothetical protein Q9173_006742 [Seirophora scorigena]
MAPKRHTRRQNNSAQPLATGGNAMNTGRAFWQGVNQLGDAHGNKLVKAFLDLGFEAIRPQRAKLRFRAIEQWVTAKKEREKVVGDAEAPNRDGEVAEEREAATKEKEAAKKSAQAVTEQSAAARAGNRPRGRPARKTVAQSGSSRQGGPSQNDSQLDPEVNEERDEQEDTESSELGDQEDSEQYNKEDDTQAENEQDKRGQEAGQKSVSAEQPQDKRKKRPHGSNHNLDRGQRETRQRIEEQRHREKERQQEERRQQEEERQEEKQRQLEEKRKREEERQEEKRRREEEREEERQRQQEEKRRREEEREEEKQRQQEEKRQREKEREEEKQRQQEEKRQQEEQRQEEKQRQQEEKRRREKEPQEEKQREQEERSQREEQRQREEQYQQEKDRQREEQRRRNEKSQIATPAKDLRTDSSQEPKSSDKYPLSEPDPSSSSPLKAPGPDTSQTRGRQSDGQGKGPPHARVEDDVDDESTPQDTSAVVSSQSAAASHAQSRPASQASATQARLIPFRSPLSRDEAGIASLLAASEIPDPLRLSARSSSKENLLKTLEELRVISANDERSTVNSEVKIIRFLGALFDPSSYWMLRQNMFAYVERTGFRQMGTVDEAKMGHQHSIGGAAAHFSIGHAPAHDTCPNAPLKAKEYLDMFAEQWRYFSQFSQQTSTKAVISLTRLRHEELCYSYWCKLQVLWRKSNPGYGSNNDDPDLNDPEVGGYEGLSAPRSNAGDVDDADSPDIQIDTDAMLDFLTAQMKLRRVELKLRSPENQAHTVKLLKTLVAPFLGLTVTPRMWTNTMKAGRIVRALRQTIGWGALAVIKWESIRIIGPEMLIRILPVIAANHPDLKETLLAVERVFLHPLRGSDMRLCVEDVGHFLRLKNIDRLRRACADDANGLKGVLEAKFTSLGPHVSVTTAWAALQTIEAASPSGAVEHSSAPAVAARDPDDNDSVVCDPNEQLLEADPSRQVTAAARGAPGKVPVLLPTPPSSTRRTVRNTLKRPISPGEEESPTKRR